MLFYPYYCGRNPTERSYAMESLKERLLRKWSKNPAPIERPSSMLVADDDSDIVGTIKETAAVEMHTCAVDTCGNGNACVSMWMEKRYPIIILDMMMPGRSGFLVVEKINEELRLHPAERPVIIVITGNMSKRHKPYFETLGIDGYLFKPLKMEELFTAIRHALEKRRPAP